MSSIANQRHTLPRRVIHPVISAVELGKRTDNACLLEPPRRRPGVSARREELRHLPFSAQWPGAGVLARHKVGADSVVAYWGHQHAASRAAHYMNPVVGNRWGLDKGTGNYEAIGVARHRETCPTAYLGGSPVCTGNQPCLKLSVLTVFAKPHTGRSAWRHRIDNNPSPHLGPCFRRHAQQRFLHIGVIEVERTNAMRC